MTAPRKKRDPTATRLRILEAAKTSLVAGDGSFEMSWVAKAAGVSQGLAYHHFGSKEGLLSAVVEDFYDRVEASVLMARYDDYEDWALRERDRSGVGQHIGPPANTNGCNFEWGLTHDFGSLGFV